MTVKPLSLSFDLSTITTIDNASVFSVINTNNAAVKLIIDNGVSPVEIHLSAGERLTVEKEYTATVLGELSGGGVITASTVFANKVAYTN
jgi:hypothetical protein